jgi:hypothetical protein
VSPLHGAAIGVGVGHARERDVETGLDQFGDSAVLGAGIDFWMDDSKVVVILSR